MSMRREPSKVGMHRQSSTANIKRPDSSHSSATSARPQLSFDQRHHFIFSKVAEGFGFSSNNIVESFASKENNHIVINDFLKENGTRKLMFFYQPREKTGDDSNKLKGPARLMLTSGETAGLRGKCVYFLRTSPKAITLQHYEAEVVYGVLDHNLLEELQTILGDVMFESITPDHACWGQLLKEAKQEPTKGATRDATEGTTISRFREQMNRFVTTVTEAWHSLRETVDLAPPEGGILDGIENTPAAFQRAAGKHHIVEKLEETMRGWCSQIEHVLAESDQVRKEDDLVGPNAELEHWKHRMARFTKLTDQLKSRDSKIVVGVLQAAKSKSLQAWKELDNRVTDAANEAKDNVKYLYTLEKFTEPLYKGEPRHIMEAIPGLINAIKMMHNIARYYNTSERMTSLFIKITNQMILSCKKYIRKDGSIWEQDKDELTAKLHECIELNEVYQEYFRQTKVKMQSMSNGRQFEFSEVYIFGKFDVFCKRLDAVVVLVDIIDQFKQLQACINVDGIPQLLTEFKSLRRRLQNREYDILDPRLVEFDDDFEEFQEKVADLESRVRGVVTDAFRNAPTTEHALHLLKMFEAVLQRDSYQTDIDTKYMLIFNTYGNELEYVKKLYERYKDSPPIARNTPQVAGSISWSRQLLRRIENPMQVFQNRPQVLHASEAKSIIRTYNRVASALIEFETLYYEGWVHAVNAAKVGLNATILVKDPNGRLYVNFDKSILQLIRETTCLMRMGGLTIPPAALLVKAQEEKFKHYVDSLTFMLKEYERVANSVDGIHKQLMAPIMDDLASKIAPGMVSLTWTSMNIDSYLKTVHDCLNKVDEIMVKADDIINCRIRLTLVAIGESHLIDLGETKSWTLQELPKVTKEHAINQGNAIELQSQGVEAAVQDLVTLITNHYPDGEVGSDLLQDKIGGLMSECDQMLFDSLVKATTGALNSVRSRVLQTGLAPLFKSEVFLESTKILVKPDMDDIIDAVGLTSKSILEAWEEVRVWGQDRSQPVNDLRSIYSDVAQDKDVLRAVLNLVGQLLKYGRSVTEYLAQFDKYRFLWEQPAVPGADGSGSDDPAYAGDEQAMIENVLRPSAQVEYDRFVEGDPSLDEYEVMLQRFSALEAEISSSPKESVFSSWLIDVTPLLSALKDLATEWKQTYANNLIQQAKQGLEELERFMDETSTRLTQDIEDLDDVRAVMTKLLELRQCEVEMEFKIKPIEETYSMLQTYRVDLSKSGLEAVDTLAYKWQKLIHVAAQANDRLFTVHVDFKSELVDSVHNFVADVREFKADYDKEGPMVRGIKPRVAVERLKAFQRGFDERERKYLAFKQGEELFGLPLTEYPELVQMKKELGLLQRLYDLYTEVLSTIGGYEEMLWAEVNFEVINEEVSAFQTRCRKLPKAMREWEAYVELRQRIDDFLESAPLMEALASKAMRARHWDAVQDICQCKFHLDAETFKLKNLMDAPLLQHRDDIEEITTGAVKEAEIEVKIAGIHEDWSEMIFVFAPFKTRGELLLKPSETSDIITQLEDSQMALNGMMGSRYIVPFKKELEEWQRKLATASEVIEHWLEVQALWVYLEAVFSGGDIAKQLPQEAKRFTSIDKQWIKIMTRAGGNPNVIDVCYKDDMVRNLLPHLMEQLELCQKSLSGYLETKRFLFPRFYLVSDPVLLEILGQGSDPTAVQPHLAAIFAGINTIHFHEKRPNEVLKMESPEGEIVPLSDPVTAEGNVEDWLAKLESHMRYSVKDVVRDCSHIVAGEMNWDDFIVKFPSQVVILGMQMWWTRICEDALAKAKTEKGVMQHTKKKFTQLLRELTEMTTRDLKGRLRTKVETLVTIHVHQKDVWDALLSARVKSLQDFEWTKQTRFYWKAEQDDCLISVCDIDFTYAYEYLGCKDRLVITPLTDRCYITLSQALGMFLGGAPAGPAGTGKTETVKDMGKSLGKYVVVLNCSDQMDYRFLGRTFKGISMSGCWGCFDEFNRIELEVLSVVGQQVQCILTAMRERKVEFPFTDGSTVRLTGSCGFFVTMNPGYAGRQELPENVKSLFRSVSMMVPDRQIIMRVKLSSQGFQEAVVLAMKFNILYKLCEEQLSKQRHYDFGLRNILSVLRTAGTAKRVNPNMTEQVILMRALRDMNLSKLVAEDEPLFLSLIDNLFPGVQVEKTPYPELQEAIATECQKKKLINHPDWNLKVIQLFETSRVRHGIMVLGPSGAGKTCAIRTLMNALTMCDSAHKEVRLNPKAITAHQMFGRLDVSTNDWMDGIFSSIWRQQAKQKKSNVWICLDGPVDAIWIENLNTVLDDNKTLTLANSDRIAMSDLMKLIFEVEDLRNASPATVSRAGMIYMSAINLGWKPVVEAWLQALPQKDAAIALNSMFDENLTPIFDWFVDNVSHVISNADVNMVTSMLRMLGRMIDVAVHNNRGAPLAGHHLEHLFTFALAWSLGGTLDTGDRQKLHAFIADNLKLDMPAHDEKHHNRGDTVFEYHVDDQGDWRHWSHRVEPWVYPTDRKPEFSSILVPTVDTVRLEYLIDLFASQSLSVLLVGQPGTAKTVTMSHYTAAQDPEETVLKSINFSYATTPMIFQRIVEGSVEKRQGHTYGPPGGRRMIVFIDDINMPEINEWGDQVTNESVRQLIEDRGFYNLDVPGEWSSVKDLQFVAAMNQPGGGKNDVPSRLKRHFFMINCALPSAASMDLIYGTMLRGHFCAERGFSQDLAHIVEKLPVLTRELWNLTKTKMLPTPAKFHYIFNLRDLSRITQGMLQCDSSVVNDVKTMLQLWRHECERVLPDKFVAPEDTNWFNKTIANVLRKHFDEPVCGPVINEAPTYWVDFLREEDDETGEEPKVYEMVPDLDTLRVRIEEKMNLFNEYKYVRGVNLDLVLFDDAVTHLCKISRILRTPRGNALLVGVGGSGKQSLTRLASFIAGYQIFQIQITKTYNTNNLMDDLRELYKIAGARGQPVTFLFTDQEIKDESFLEYINNILTSGEVANLFAKDEMDMILSELRAIVRKERPGFNDTMENLYGYFLDRVRDNLHVVLCFSPVGDKFSSRAQKFPGLVNGCTIDWFTPWPKQALLAVAEKFFADFELQNEDGVKQQLTEFMATVHDTVGKATTDYFNKFRRHVYFTPKSYLSFIQDYMKVYRQKSKDIGVLANNINVGLSKLLSAGEDVAKMRVLLEAKDKELAEAQKVSTAILEEVTAQTAIAETRKAAVQETKDELSAKADEINKNKEEAERDLEAAKPALEEAEQALLSIKPADISVLKKLASPAHLIRRVMDGVLILRGFPLLPAKVDTDLAPDTLTYVPSWQLSQRMMNAGNFLNELLGFEKDNINAETVELLQPYFDMPDFTYEAAKRVSGNVAGLCSWIKAMAVYYEIAKEVAPKRAAVFAAEQELEQALHDLSLAQADLDEKQKALDEMTAKYEAAMAERQKLQESADLTRRRMDSANSLIAGLKDEKDRWTKQSSEFADTIRRLVGDTALATAFVSYAGPFNEDFRKMLLESTWTRGLTAREIPFTSDLKITDFLTTEATVGEWNLQGLPTDELSVQNGILSTSSTKYALLIDPQGQGKNWIKNREEERGLVITNLNHKYFRTSLENALANGTPLLIEDVEEELDPVLDNVLDRQWIKVGRSLRVKVGDKECDLTEGFTLYVTTKLANPHYSPETFAKVSVIDFTVTRKGLESQLLGRVIHQEQASLEDQRQALLKEVNENKKKLQQLEDDLLFRLSNTQGNLVDDETLIEVLATTKHTVEEVTEKLANSLETEKKINAMREEYRAVATRGSIIYFLVAEMSLVNPMYQTSLAQFLKLFDLSIKNSDASPIPRQRIANIIDFATYTIYKFICRGLFENHKQLFSLQLCLKINLEAGRITMDEFSTLIKGGAALDPSRVRPKPFDWIPEKAWLNLAQLQESVSIFRHILEQIERGEEIWKKWYDLEQPEQGKIPDGYQRTLDEFHRLLLVRCWREDRALLAVSDYIVATLDNRFVDSIPLQMEETVQEAGPYSPIICILSPGADPTELIKSLAQKLRIDLKSISMGQGQEKDAMNLITNGSAKGGWVLLQNCHLGLKFMTDLEVWLNNSVEQDSSHDQFQLFLTSEPHPRFPIGLLQSSIKVTNEAPRGVKAGLKRSFAWVNQEMLDAIDKPQWKPLLYTICFLHTTVQERRKFGALGWNIPYEFNQSDLAASVQYLQNYLYQTDVRKGVSWPSVRYMICEVQYGGRITDDIDRELMNTYGKAWFDDAIFRDDFAYHKGYGIPSLAEMAKVESLRKTVEDIPLHDTPEIFGLHPNADLTSRSNQTADILDTILSIQPKDSNVGGGETREEKVLAICADILSKLPEDYVKTRTRAKLKKLGGSQFALNIFLAQEIDRVQVVITLMKRTLTDLKLAIGGTIVMSSQLIDILNALHDARVPASWEAVSWPSTSIGFWLNDLLGRINQYTSWLEDGRPRVFWMTGFFNPQGFLTSMMQEMCRKNSWPLDEVQVTTEALKEDKEEIRRPPEDGVFIHGLFLDGASFSKNGLKIVDSAPKVLFYPMPVIHVSATNEKPKQKEAVYQCPVYSKPKRTDLNFIFRVDLRTPDAPPDKWILRGVALLCSKN
eukprot:TRINITY_DN730_c0_g2_i1.p1 TRINITY_DN730_c0_g2~~TRINITY_DN730_c0_g2_i1.p1  ORF type:complete len:4569 (+),score=1602.08 TRINITY_DN730_c0_g2_i1:399-14105(+)